MGEVVGHAPLLLGLLLANLNNHNNNASMVDKGIMPPTLVLHNQIAEADYLRTLLKTQCKTL